MPSVCLAAGSQGRPEMVHRVFKGQIYQHLVSFGIKTDERLKESFPKLKSHPFLDLSHCFSRLCNHP